MVVDSSNVFGAQNHYFNSKFETQFYSYSHSVPRVASAVTWSCGPPPWRGCTHGPPNNSTCLTRVLQDPEDDRHGIGGGGGEDTNGDRRREGGRKEGRVQQGEGARSDHENTLPLGGRVLGHVRLYGEMGRGGRGQTERRVQRPSRGIKSVEDTSVLGSH